MKDPISKWANEAQKRNKKDFADTSEAKLAEQDLLDEALDAMHELHVYKKHIKERLALHRRAIADFVDNEINYDIMARYHELVKLKYDVDKELNHEDK